MLESQAQFEKRKIDHIRIALDPRSQSDHSTGVDSIRLIHDALPDINFSEVSISRTLFGQELRAPVFISSMTAGHEQGQGLNRQLAQAAERRQWAMGVGSQRKELSFPEAAAEWKTLRKVAPKALLVGNLGLAQVIQSPTSSIESIVGNLEAAALFVHLNPLQEVLQKEGTPEFKGGLQALENLCRQLSVPVIIKEVGCGISSKTLKKLQNIGIYAVDVAGLGGTHWGRIEGLRSEPGEVLYETAQTFKNWGLTSVECLLAAKKMNQSSPLGYKIWASGGVRSGLDVAKFLALGAEMVGMAKPLLEAAIQGEDFLDRRMKLLEYELSVAVFCTGCKNLDQLSSGGSLLQEL